MPLLQKDRLLSITTPLGADVLLVDSLEGTELVSGLFRFQLVLVSEKKSIALPDLVGQRVTVKLELPGKKQRPINGFVSRFSQGDVDQRVSWYYAEVVPWLWFLTRTTDCRIFQKKNVPDIIKQIFQDLNFTDFKLQLQGNFEPRDYCVQYRETDFNFVSRLMEEEGMFYFFEHTDSKHTLIIGNDPGVHQPCPNQAQARYAYLQGGYQDKDVVTRWHLEQEFQPGKYSLTDYYFPTPSANLRVTAPSAVKVANNDKFELYDYPGYYAKRFDGDGQAGKVRPDGERTAKLGMQGPEAQHKVVSGAGCCRAFVPGYKFELTEHRRADFNAPYVLTQVSHTATSNLGDSEGSSYENSFTCIPAAVPFRPAHVSPKPIVHGAQTAVVVGSAGAEIDPDKYGRVKVQFHWDREGKKNLESSCSIRVATPWAGKNWGMIHIPRIGQEVIVAFLEGDPDQPIIVGSVYNAEQMPPYDLPGNKTQSGIKSRSSLGGSPANFNEFRFEDKKGSEQVFLHAEKNQDIEVENDETHWVGHDRKKTIDNDETTLVKHDRTETVNNNETITIHGKRTETVDKDETILIHQNRTETVDKNETITIHGGRTETVDKDEKITISGGRTENVSKDENITISGGRTENVSKDESITIGGGRTESVSKDEGVTVSGGRSVSIGKNDTLNVGKTLTITAEDSIILKTGKAQIVMKKNGDIMIEGAKIQVKGSSEIKMKAPKIVEN